MNLVINDNGDTIPYKNIKEFSFSIVGIDIDWGENYHAILLSPKANLSKLLKNHELDNSVKFYFFNEILYIVFKELDHYYMADDFTSEFIQQIKNRKQIVFVIGDEENLEEIFLFDKILG